MCDSHLNWIKKKVDSSCNKYGLRAGIKTIQMYLFKLLLNRRQPIQFSQIFNFPVFFLIHFAVQAFVAPSVAMVASKWNYHPITPNPSFNSRPPIWLHKNRTRRNIRNIEVILHGARSFGPHHTEFQRSQCWSDRKSRKHHHTTIVSIHNSPRYSGKELITLFPAMENLTLNHHSYTGDLNG